MPDAITLTGVGKRYRQTNDDAMMLKQMARTLTGRRRVTELWALRDLDLRVEQGETIGVIGRNGSGKTTLLRLLAGVSAPTVGRLRVVGSIAPLIGVGVGFNPELTGRENVFANGQILGLPKSQLVRDFDDIVGFAELERFVDTPVKFYSSGMFLRLAFAVAIQVEPEVLLIDEVLAVGDMAFQLKCFERMDRLKRKGTTVVIVTHSIGMLGRLCNRAVLLSQGEKVFDGELEEALGRYQDVMRIEDADRVASQGMLAQQGTEHLYAGGATIVATIADEDGAETNRVSAGEPICLRARIELDHEVRNPVFGAMVTAGQHGSVYMVHTEIGEYVGAHGPGRPIEVNLRLQTPVLEGSYRVQLNVFDEDGETVLGKSRPEPFYVSSGARAVGVTDLRGVLEVGGEVVADLADGRSTASARESGRA
jgi:ABC-type polysaccharide/polyol phosphate transport system ATPase subunit